MSKGSRKGGAFERLIATRLSQWWSGGTEDRLFWRTAGSGSSATVRSGKGKRSANQEGDTMSLTPDASHLTRFFSFELKKGYGAWTFHDLADSCRGKGPPPVWHWMKKASECAARSGALHWALVWRRDQRREMIAAPAEAFCQVGASVSITMTLSSRVTAGLGEIAIARLDDFLTHASPDAVRAAVNQAGECPHTPVTVEVA
jgi:hypothetical protein